MGDTDSFVVTNFWKAKPDTTLGLLDIVTLDGNVIAQDIEETIAEHLVNLHNIWWETRLWGSYLGNIAWTYDRDHGSAHLDKYKDLD